MKLACGTLPERGRSEALIAEVPALPAADRVRLAGTVKRDGQRAGRQRCDMDLIVLPDGPIVRISEDRGTMARGCMSDSGALEQAALSEDQRSADAEILIVSPFGKRGSEDSTPSQCARAENADQNTRS